MKLSMRSNPNRIAVLGSRDGIKTPWCQGEGCVHRPPPAMVLQPSLFLILHLLVLRTAAQNCAGLRSLKQPNVSITDAVPLIPGTTFDASADPTCVQPTYNNTVAICRVRGEVNTSSTSSITFEMWLPDTWYGRVLTVGNGALGGCKQFLLSRTWSRLR